MAREKDRVRTACLAVLLISAAALALPAQVVVEEIGALQDAFGRAQEAFQAFKFKDALAQLDSVVDALSKWERSGRLQPADEVLLTKALELRGVCAFNTGKLDLARQDFARLVQLRPEYPFAAGKGAKIQRFFEDVRDGLTGTLALEVDPPGSQVRLDGRLLGEAGTLSLPVLKGLHVLEVTHPGFDSQRRELNVAVGQTIPVSLRLAPNARTIYFFVQPKGVELSVDGKTLGKATAPASSQEDWKQFVEETGDDAASTYVVAAPYLPPGDRKVSLSLRCYQKQEFKLQVVLNRTGTTPGFVRPIKLQRQTVELRVDSVPPGARVTVDGQDLGVTPLTVPGFCIGEHEFLVSKPGVGEYRATHAIPAGAPYRLEAVLRPTLLWAGLTRDQEITADQLGAVQSDLEEALGRLSFFNATLSQENNPLLPDTFFTPGVGAQEQQAAAADLCARYRCEGVLAGRLASASGKAQLTLRLFVPGLAGYDEYRWVLAKDRPPWRILTEIDRPVADASAGKMFSVAEVPGSKAPVILKVAPDPEGPAAGDLLLGVGDVPAASAAEARKALDTAGTGPVRLRFSHAGQERSWLYDPAKYPVLVPYGGLGFGFRRAWLLSRQAALSSVTPEQRLFAAMSLACAELALSRPQQALTALDGLTAPASGLLSESALNYLRAVALVQLERPAEAYPLLAAAADDPQASLDGRGEILLQPLALDLLHQLPPPQSPPSGLPLPGNSE